jgi:hypothetical protein
VAAAQAADREREQGAKHAKLSVLRQRQVGTHLCLHSPSLVFHLLTWCVLVSEGPLRVLRLEARPCGLTRRHCCCATCTAQSPLLFWCEGTRHYNFSGVMLLYR